MDPTGGLGGRAKAGAPLLMAVMALMVATAAPVTADRSSAGGRTPAGAAANQGSELTPVSIQIRCDAFYRRMAGGRLRDSQVLFVSKDGDRATATFPAMALEIDYRDTSSVDGERTLTVRVVLPDGDERVRTLYQLRPDRVPRNQFISHGFTGLVYFTRGMGAELQYFCSTDEQSALRTES